MPIPAWAPFGRTDTEQDAEARALRQVARLRQEARSGVDAGYVHFHTLCMGIKLSMSEQPRLRNVSPTLSPTLRGHLTLYQRAAYTTWQPMTAGAT